MSHTYLSLRFHLVWATRHRRPWLDPEWRSRLFACAGSAATRNGARLLCAGGARDHLHLYLDVPATLAVSELVNSLKTTTARWVHQAFSHRRDFAWQGGYAAFTVSGYDDAKLRDYIRNQEAHHRERPFAREYLALLDQHGLSYDLTHAID